MADERTEPRTAKLQFHYIKGPTYREISCHGVIGGVTGDKLWMGIFAERGPIPRLVEFEVDTPENEEVVAFDESNSVPSRIDSRTGIIRHVECTAYMDLDTANKIHEWLSRQLEQQKDRSGK